MCHTSSGILAYAPRPTNPSDGTLASDVVEVGSRGGVVEMIQVQNQRCAYCGELFDVSYVCEKCGKMICTAHVAFDADSPFGIMGRVCFQCPGAHTLLPASFPKQIDLALNRVKGSHSTVVSILRPSIAIEIIE